jgi:hypothetical protein
MATAYAAVEDHVRDSKAYRSVVAMVVDLTLAETLTWKTFADGKAAGGRSAVIARSVEVALAAVPGVDEPQGSKMVPMTVRDVVRLDAQTGVLYEAVAVAESRARPPREEDRGA